MKKIIAVVVLLAVAAAALPALIGPATEEQLRAGLADVSAKQGIMETKVTSYERSYRSATAVLNMSLSDDYVESIIASGNEDGEPMSEEEATELRTMLGPGMPIRVEIEHGPLLTRFAKGLGLNSYRITLGDADWVEQLREAVGVAEVFDVFNVTGKTGLTGNSNFDLMMPAIERTNADGKFAFSGLTGSGTWSNSSRDMAMEASSEFLQADLAEDNLSMSMKNLSVDLGVNLKNPALGLGTSTFNLDNFSLSLHGDAPFAAQNAGFDTIVKMDESGERVDVSLVYRVDEVVAQGITVSDATATFEIKGLTPAVLEQYQTVASNPIIDEAQIAAYMDLGYNALKSSPQLNIGPIKFKANDETFDGIMTVSVDGAALPDSDNFNFADVGMWMSVITQSLDVRATEGLVNQAVDGYMMQQAMASPDAAAQLDAATMAQQRGMMLEQLLAQGMITRDDNGYALDVDFNKGEMTVNGNPFPIEALLGP